MAAPGANPHGGEGDVTRRDFLIIATGAFAVAGTVWTAVPFIAQMNPDAAALALGSIEVDISPIVEGQSIIVKWRGKPVVIRYRTAKEMQEAQQVQLDELRDRYARNANLASDAPATDANRTIPGKEEWMVMIQVCTHLGCIPLGQQGEYDGWFCPCHGSQYDTAGRIRKGPAPENMPIPPYAFTTDTMLRIG